MRAMVKVPDPVHPDCNPASVHVPEIVLLFSVPCRLSVLFPVLPVDGLWIFSEKPPVTAPLKFPVRENAPVWVAPLAKQPLLVLNVRLVPVTLLSLLVVSVVVNANAWAPLWSVKVAVQFPLTLPLLLFELPHAKSSIVQAKRIVFPSTFI
jgi:hypothetical protein